MKTVNYHLITTAHREHENPGDILIGKGIQYLLRSFENRIGRMPIFNYIDIFDQPADIWDFCYDHADIVVLCGTPQLNQNEIPDRFGIEFYKNLKKCKALGKKVVNLWTGFCYQDCLATTEQSVNSLLKYKDFIKNNFSVFDFIVARDEVTTKVIEHAGLSVTQLIDCVSFAPYWYNIEASEKKLNVFVPRDIGEHNPKIAARFKQIEQDYSDVVYVCHSYNDYKFYKNHFKNILVANVHELIQFYSMAKNVISLRIHGSVLASHFGCNLLNVSMDSRANILEYMGLQSMDLFTFEEKSVDIMRPVKMNITNQISESKDRFFKLYRQAMGV